MIRIFGQQVPSWGNSQQGKIESGTRIEKLQSQLGRMIVHSVVTRLSLIKKINLSNKKGSQYTN